MSDTARARGWVARLPIGLGSARVVHFGFFTLLGGCLIEARGYPGNTWYCAVVILDVAALGLIYSWGQRTWEALGSRRPVWLLLLIASWALLTMLVPLFVWCAPPLVCSAARMSRRSLLATTAAMSVVVVALPTFPTDTAYVSAVLAPLLSIWMTGALYFHIQQENDSRRRLLEELSRTQAELATAQRRSGVLAERARLAREIHDGLVQGLAGARMMLQAAERDWDQVASGSRGYVRCSLQILGESIDDARRLIHDLVPQSLETEDLAAALAELCARAGMETSARIDFRTLGQVRPVAPEQEVALLRVVQGALANAREHAQARRIAVTLGYDEGSVTVSVSDDGVGFDPGAVQPWSGETGRGYGLTAIRERLALCGGHLQVNSSPGRGAMLAASVPTLGGAAVEFGSEQVDTTPAGRPVTTGVVG